MPFFFSQSNKDELHNIPLIEEYKVNLEEKIYDAIIEENSNINNAYSATANLPPEKNTPEYSWFKGSKDRGFRGNIAA